jgi:hypothetical protein
LPLLFLSNFPQMAESRPGIASNDTPDLRILSLPDSSGSVQQTLQEAE